MIESNIIELLTHNPNILHKNNINITSIELSAKLQYLDIYNILTEYCVNNNIDYLSSQSPDKTNINKSQQINYNDSDSITDSKHEYDSTYSDSDYHSMSSSVSSSTSEMSDQF